jgi:tetratricopeptide (TPR) repeat protein
MYTEKDPSNAVAWYYLGNAYMNIAMKQDAHNAYEKVIALNTVPKLTSYSIQAELCMENSAKCKYQDFTSDEIKKLKADPSGFLQAYFANMNATTKDQNVVEIENLINGSYGQNIHPSALEFIRQEEAKMKQNEINEDKV